MLLSPADTATEGDPAALPTADAHGAAEATSSRSRTAPPARGAVFGWLLLLLGSVGMLMASVLLIEKLRILEDPSYVPSCSINPVLSCGSIMTTWQAEAFGFPNPILGIAGFAVVATTGAVVVAGARLARWYWLGLLVGTTVGVAFVHWLVFQSLYRIGALCPYCMVVWVVTIAVFWYTLLHLAGRSGGISESSWYRRVTAYHGVVLTAWYLGIGTLIAIRFWDYWSTLA